MQIMMCGSKDVESFLEPFQEQVYLIESQPISYLDGNLAYSNFQNWKENSIDTLKASDVAVFVVNQQYGKITWEEEFKVANQEGTNYIILCQQDTYNNYLNFNWAAEAIQNSTENTLNVYKALLEVDRLQKTIIPFTVNTFAPTLRKQLNILLTKAAKALKSENRKSIILQIVRSRDQHSVRELAKKENNVFLKELLRDIFQAKEVRKRILECFTLIEELYLVDAEIIDLLNDSEQGVRRKTIQLLPQLIRKGISNLDFLFENIMKLSDDADDVGIDRRAIVSMLEIDMILATRHLLSLKMDDIGTPRRIVQWFEAHEDAIKAAKGNDAFVANYKTLLELCDNPKKAPAKVKDIVEKIVRWVE